jgi:hypothetical protein
MRWPEGIKMLVAILLVADGLTADKVPAQCRTSTHQSYFLASPGSMTALLPPS